jgi:hypothetical protein
LLCQLSYPSVDGKGFEPSTHKKKTTSGQAACYIVNQYKHYGAIQKLASGLRLSVFSALSRKHSLQERSLVPVSRVNIFIKELFNVTLSFELKKRDCRDLITSA